MANYHGAVLAYEDPTPSLSKRLHVLSFTITLNAGVVVWRWPGLSHHGPLPTLSPYRITARTHRETTYAPPPPCPAPLCPGARQPRPSLRPVVNTHSTNDPSWGSKQILTPSNTAAARPGRSLEGSPNSEDGVMHQVDNKSIRKCNRNCFWRCM